MPTSNLTQRRRIFKQFKSALELPDPCRSYEDFQKMNNEDLSGMDRLELRNEWNRAELALMLADGDLVLYMDSKGNMITARAYLLQRLAEIRRLLKGAA